MALCSLLNPWFTLASNVQILPWPVLSPAKELKIGIRIPGNQNCCWFWVERYKLLVRFIKGQWLMGVSVLKTEHRSGFLKTLGYFTLEQWSSVCLSLSTVVCRAAGSGLTLIWFLWLEGKTVRSTLTNPFLWSWVIVIPISLGALCPCSICKSSLKNNAKDIKAPFIS